MNARLIRLSAAAVIFGGIAAISAGVFSNSAFAHGDVVPQAVDTTGLEPLGKDWKESNPYRGNERAIEIGKSAFNQNCARCHGLGAVSGGIAPDLRFLEPVRDYKARHASTMLTFDAVAQALDQIEERAAPAA